jgi:hypothetical protein
MSRTRAELDEKLTLLHVRMNELTPKKLGERYVPEYLLDRVIGSVLTLVGLKLAWSHYRSRVTHRDRVRARLAAYSTW